MSVLRPSPHKGVQKLESQALWTPEWVQGQASVRFNPASKCVFTDGSVLVTLKTSNAKFTSITGDMPKEINHTAGRERRLELKKQNLPEYPRANALIRELNPDPYPGLEEVSKPRFDVMKEIDV